MDFSYYLALQAQEKPLDRLLPGGGLCGIFRTIGCIGDSLSSGEFESEDKNGVRGYHDYYEYSWGQYLARDVGCKVWNFSRGGMTAKEYWESYAAEQDLWAPEKACQAYILALGVNDLLNEGQPMGTVDELNLQEPDQNPPTMLGYYVRIILRLRIIQPKARFFFMSMPRVCSDSETARQRKEAFSAALHQLSEQIPYSYVLDFYRDAPVYDAETKRRIFLRGHLNASGYLLTARMVSSYIDYLIRKYPWDFTEVGFIGTPYHT